MDPNIFRFPPPYSANNFPRIKAPHFMTSEGMMMPSHMQPPPMYGPRGSTIPPRFLGKYKKRNFNVKERKDDDFYCEICDYDFTSRVAFQKHVSEHQTCNIDGCAFIAHPDILSRHVEQQHKSGLYEKLKNIDTPEAIAKWREERRKRYPTQANVALRQQVQSERVKRGERISDRMSRFGQRTDREKCKHHESNNTTPASKKRKRTRKRKHVQKNENQSPADEQPEEIEDESSVRRFKGTSNLPDYTRPAKIQKTKQKNALASLAGLYGSDDDISNSDNSDQDTDEDRQEDEDSKISTEIENTSCQFNISSDEEDYGGNKADIFDLLTNNNQNSNVEAPEAKKIDEKESESITRTDVADHSIKTLHTQSSEATKQINSTEDTTTKEPVQPYPKLSAPSEDKEEIDDEDQQVEVPFQKIIETFPDDDDNTTKIDNTKTSERKKKQHRNKVKSNEDGKPAINIIKRKPKKSGLDYSKLRRRPQNTMLEKLLQADIIHERNVLLQCVRYVVEKNFFGIGQKTTVETKVDT